MEKFKLPKAKKAKWIKALISGKYKQGIQMLHNKSMDSYCCLGVAREEGLCRKLPGAGFVSFKFLPEDIQYKLVMMNDSKRWSFKTIADWIEKNL